MAEYTNNYSLSNELVSFKKSIASNNRQAIEKYLTQIKNLSQEFLNQALFWCIENYKVETDQCLPLLIRYTAQNAKSKANLNCQINLQTPLIAACKKGQLTLVKRLIENGAKPDLTNSENKHPLEFILTSREENYDVADYVISQMQTVNFLINNKHSILIAVQREFHRVFKYLLEKGSEIVFQDENLLHFIMKQKFKKVNKKKKFLKQMINKYALFTQVDKNGKTPIQYQENEQIKAYYAENFKVKKIIEPLTSSIQRVSNNSSIFINLKSSKKESRAIAYERKKNLTESNQGVSKNVKESIKEVKLAGKESKDDDGSLEEEIEDKQDSENNEDQDKPSQKITKISNPSSSLRDGKKSSVTTKPNQNSSFILTNQSSTISKQQGSSIVVNTSTKYKSKYSSIGPKTQTYLKNYPISSKRANDSSTRGETKKVSGNLNTSNNTTKDSSNIKKKKISFEDEKKEMGSNKKINISDSSKTSPIKEKRNEKQKQDENQKKQNLPMQDKENQTLDEQNQAITNNTTSSQQIYLNEIKQVDELGKIQAEIFLQKCESNQEIQSQKLSEETIIVETQNKNQWEKALESCQKMMQQFIIKQESQITHLNELKEKLNEVFSKYQSQNSKSENSIKFSESQKLKEIKVSNNNIKSENSHKNSKISKESSITNIPSICKLSQEISSIELNCEQQANRKSECIFLAMQMISTKVHSVLQSSRKEKIEVSIEMYGSRANGLQIQTSDIDLLIVCNINNGVKDLMLQLERSGSFNSSQINEAKFLVNTSMPIMKLSLNSAFMHMNIDLTFQVRGHTGLRCTSLIKQFIAAEELLKPLVLTLKTLLGHYDLCDTYTGGLGSYSLTLMTIALLQFTQIKKTRQNLGDIFLQFLLFYGFQMDYVCQAIIIHPPGFNEKPAFSIYQLPFSLDLTPKLIIYDPLNPVNNVGRATYRIVQLKKLFKIWYVKLRTELYGAKNGISQLMNMKNQLLERTRIVV